MNKKTLNISAILIATVLIFAGCASIFSTETPPRTGEPGNVTAETNPTTDEPNCSLLHQLKTEMHFVAVSVHDDKVLGQFDAKIDAVIDSHSDAEDAASIYIELPSDRPFQFRSQVASELLYEDADLPYYCINGRLYNPTTDGYFPHVFAIDFDSEYVLFYVSSNVIDWYTVGSTDPDADPDTILLHFKELFELRGDSELLNSIGAQ